MKALKDMDDLPKTTEVMIKRNVFASDKGNGSEDKHILHKRLVFSDKEFTQPLLEMVVKYDLIKGTMDLSKFVKGTRDYANISFTKKDGTKAHLTETEVNLVNNLAKEFAVLPEDATSYMMRVQNSKAAIGDRVALAYRHGIGLYLRIGEGATREEIKNALKDVDSAMVMAYGKGRALKNKPPENYELVYAIFRATRKDQGMAETYRQYQAGELANYKGHNNIETLEKFREYYAKYKPDNPL